MLALDLIIFFGVVTIIIQNIVCKTFLSTQDPERAIGMHGGSTTSINPLAAYEPSRQRGKQFTDTWTTEI